MKRGVVRLLTILFLATITMAGCVPMSEQIIGTWEFSGLKYGVTQSFIPTDSTVFFGPNGEGYYYLNSNATHKTALKYNLSDNGTIVISIGSKEKTVNYSIEWKSSRLVLDGVVYRRIGSVASIETQRDDIANIPLQTTLPSPGAFLLSTPKPKLVGISVADEHTVGLYENGTIKTTECTFPQKVEAVKEWNNIVSVSAGYAYTAGITRDGTLAITSNFVAENYTGDNLYIYNEPGEWTKEWTNLIQIDVGTFAIAGVRSDGTAIAKVPTSI